MPTPRSVSRVRGARETNIPGALAWMVASALLWPPPVEAIGPGDRRFSSSRVGISIEAPAGWTFSQHTGYTDTLVLLLHPDGSRISVTVGPTAALSSAALYEQNRPGFATQGLVASPLGAGVRGTFAVDLSARGRPDQLRQLYLTRDVPQGRQAIVFTLVSRTGAFASRVAALDFVVTRMTLDEPLPPSGPARAGAGSSGAGGRPGR